MNLDAASHSYNRLFHQIMLIICPVDVVMNKKIEEIL